MDEKIIYEWELPSDYPNYTGFDDLPEAYRVSELDNACGGIVIYAKWKGKWEYKDIDKTFITRKKR